MTLLPGLSVHSCSLLRRWPGFDPPPHASPSGHHPLTTVAATHPPYPLLSSQRSFFPVPIRLAQWGAVNSLRSANFQDGMPTPLSEARSGTPASTSHLKWESCSGGLGVSLRRIYYFRFWHCSIWRVYQQWALVRNCPVDQPQTKESSCCRLTLNDEGAGFGGSGEWYLSIKEGVQAHHVCWTGSYYHWVSLSLTHAGIQKHIR